MNWGLFNGCKLRNGDRRGVYHLCSPDEGWKPVLRPLSSMTDEEKKEYGKEFGCCVSEFKISEGNKKGLIQVKVESLFTEEPLTEMEKLYNKCFCATWGICEVKEILWLMSKGFYVGQCEPDECIIEEVE